MALEPSFDADFYTVVATVLPLLLLATNVTARLLPEPGKFTRRALVRGIAVVVSVPISFVTELAAIGILYRQRATTIERVVVGIGFFASLSLVHAGVMAQVIAEKLRQSRGEKLADSPVASSPQTDRQDGTYEPRHVRQHES